MLIIATSGTAIVLVTNFIIFSGNRYFGKSCSTWLYDNHRSRKTRNKIIWKKGYDIARCANKVVEPLRLACLIEKVHQQLSYPVLEENCWKKNSF